MREFFKPWRRKAGVLALGFVSVLAVCFVRSFSCKDTISMSLTHHSIHHLISASGGIVIHRRSFTVRSDDPIMRPVWESGDLGQIDFGFPNRKMKSGAFLVDCGAQTDTYVASAWIHVPYWLLELPLIAFSDYLLFWQPPPPTRPSTLYRGTILAVTLGLFAFEWWLFELCRLPYRPPYDMSTFLGTEIVYVKALLILVPAVWLIFVVCHFFCFKFSAVDQSVFAVFCFLLMIASYLIVMYPLWPVAKF